MVKIKGPNPFAPWEEKPGRLYGRREEKRIFNSFVNATASKQSSSMIVVGELGMGRSLLLRYFGEETKKNGLLAPFIKVEKKESSEEVVRRLYQEVSLLPGFKEKKAPSTFEELVDIANQYSKFGSVFFIDDVDNMKRADEAVTEIARLMRAVWGKSKVSFVMSSAKEFRIKSEVMTTVKLKPLSEHDLKELVTKSLGEGPPKMGEECFNSIMKDSSGNPRIFKSICRHVYDRLRDDEKVISKGHYLAYLPHIMSMFSYEWFGRIYQETPESERMILKVLAKEDEGMHVADIAEGLGKPLGPITALIKRLLDRGQIVKISRGKYRIFVRLYAKYILQRS